MLLAWLTISWIYNSTSRTLTEQFVAPIQISIIAYGVTIFLISMIALFGTVANRKQKESEIFFGFLYFLFFGIALTIIYLTTFYAEIFR
jgi:hypothetical protein